jgi:hypothetical protein
VTEAALHHVETLDPLLHAFCTLTLDGTRVTCSAFMEASGYDPYQHRKCGRNSVIARQSA